MSAFDQYGENSPGGERALTVALDSAPAGGSILHVRLRTRLEADKPIAAGGEILDPSVCLTTDLIKASGGDLIETSGRVFVARFSALQDGVLAARRLQWAAQGFFESQNPKGTPFAVLVQQPEDTLGRMTDGAIAEVLDCAAPGQILLTNNVGKALEESAGFSLGGASDAGFRELIWRGPDQHSTRSTDERVISWFIEQKGPEFHAETYATGLDDAVSGSGDKAAESQGGHADAGWAGSSNAKLPSRTPLILSICGLAAVVLLLASVFVFHLFGGKQASPAAANVPVVGQPVPKEEAPPTQSPPPPTPSSSPKIPDQKNHKSKEREQAMSGDQSLVIAAEPPKTAEPATKQATKLEKCDLDSGQYAGEMDQADKNQAAGKYATAARQFGMVLSCDPGNGRARAGLEKAHAAENAAGGDASQ